MVIDVTVVLERRKGDFSDDDFDALADKVYEMAQEATGYDPFFAVSAGEPIITLTLDAETLADAVLRARDVVQNAELGAGEIRYIGLDEIGWEQLENARASAAAQQES